MDSDATGHNAILYTWDLTTWVLGSAMEADIARELCDQKEINPLLLTIYGTYFL